MKLDIHKFLEKNSKKIKNKNAGTSLILALGLSSLILGISYATARLVTKSVERNQSIERSNQVFYAAESGLEAAFFHHNSRGTGTHFMTDNQATQKIVHSKVNANIYWKIDGRANPVKNIIKESQFISIPLFWDTSTNPSDIPNKNGKLGIGEDFTLSFQNTDIPSGFDFYDLSNEILIKWNFFGKLPDGTSEKFTPNDTVCDDPTDMTLGYICDNDVFAASSQISSSDTNILGTTLPNNFFDETINYFFNNSPLEYLQLNFQPVLKFEDSTSGKKITGIPFTLETNGTSELPKPSYSVTSSVSIGNYSKTLATTVLEKTSSNVFNYVIVN